MSYADLKKRRKGGIDRLVKAAEGAQGGKKNFNDPNEWKLKKDDQGNAYAVIRFLPESHGQELPWIQFWDHFFKGPTGQWYVEKSLTTLGQPDPVGESNGRLYNSGLDSNKEIAKKRKRKMNFVSNILVVSDPANPGNEGKVFYYKYGKKIHDKIMNALKPEFPDEQAVDVFDLENGADFRLKVKPGDGGWPDYGSSNWANPAPVSEDESRLEEVYDSQHDLGQFVSPDTFKSYAELKARLNTVLGSTGDAGVQTLNESSMLGDQTPPPVTAAAASPDSMVETEAPTISESEDDDDDDIMAKFAAMAAEG